MKIKNVNVEFIEFDAKDVIATSTHIIPTGIEVIYLDQAGIDYFNEANNSYDNQMDLKITSSYLGVNHGPYYAFSGSWRKYESGNFYYTVEDNHQKPAQGYIDLANNHEAFDEVYNWLINH